VHRNPEDARMTTDLKYLALTALLTASLWIPYIVAQVIANGLLTPVNYTDPAPRPVPLWGKRANRAHLNAVEAFAPFAAIVLVAHAAGKENAMTAFWASWFFWMRLAHAAVYMAGIPYVRTIVFTLGWVGVVGIFSEVVR
jgi:uncharacterized MAPEG superfamily protein